MCRRRGEPTLAREFVPIEGLNPLGCINRRTGVLGNRAFDLHPRGMSMTGSIVQRRGLRLGSMAGVLLVATLLTLGCGGGEEATPDPAAVADQ